MVSVDNIKVRWMMDGCMETQIGLVNWFRWKKFQIKTPKKTQPSQASFHQSLRRTARKVYRCPEDKIMNIWLLTNHIHPTNSNPNLSLSISLLSPFGFHSHHYQCSICQNNNINKICYIYPFSYPLFHTQKKLALAANSFPLIFLCFSDFAGLLVVHLLFSLSLGPLLLLLSM